MNGEASKGLNIAGDGKAREGTRDRLPKHDLIE